jgi:hypothetical protein
MSELVSKISSYNLFNYLLPWVILIGLLNHTTSYHIPDENLLILWFVAYFIWLIVSRIWSIIVEPLCKQTKIIQFETHDNYIDACKKDEKIEILSEQNNMFRTIISMLVTFSAIKLYDIISSYCLILDIIAPYITIILLIIMFLIAYRKQTSYITKRINRVLEK